MSILDIILTAAGNTTIPAVVPVSFQQLTLPISGVWSNLLKTTTTDFIFTTSSLNRSSTIKSTNSTNWTNQTVTSHTTTSFNWGTFYTAGSVIIGVSSSATATTRYLVSTDNGTTWALGTFPSNSTWAVGCSDGTTIYLVDTSFGGKLIYTTNGTSWTTVSSTNLSTLVNSLVYFNGVFYLYRNSNQYQTTTTPKVANTWSSIITEPALFSASNYLRNVTVKQDGKLWGTKLGLSGILYYSNDGTSWNQLQWPTSIGGISPLSYSWSLPIYHNGIYYCINTNLANNYFIYSADLSNWYLGNLPYTFSSTEGSSYIEIDVNNNIIIITKNGSTGTNFILKSI